MTQERPGHDQFDLALPEDAVAFVDEDRPVAPPGIPLDAFWSLVDPDGPASGV